MSGAPDGLAESAAALIVAAFEGYNAAFRGITQRARGRFERREWAANQVDATARIDLYEQCVGQATISLERMLGEFRHDRAVWAATRRRYAELIRSRNDSEFYKTFFSSLTRRVFKTIGVDADIEFVALDVRPTEHVLTGVKRHIYRNRGSVRYVFDEMLADHAFAVPYRNVERTLTYLSAEIEAFCVSQGPDSRIRAIEILDSIFYRGRRAYLVGRIDGNDWVSPLVIALRNTDEGIYADAVIVSENDVSMLFGYTRSYFHVDLDVVGATVAFLKAIMPRKPIAEIYTVLGRAKQGKTERYRHLFQHLAGSDDLFEHASGDRGMVMEVFTLPSYDVVFKLIRDRFAYPKNMSRAEVMDKYQLVFKRDRAGRLVDAQEFRRLEFDRSRFQPELLNDLLTGCSHVCHDEGEQIVIDHLYIERRLRPLNLYLKTANDEEARLAVIDYGQAIRDLALSNIFAGDLLLKNFGVTRHGRVIFYDYDELCLVTECNFRELPEAQDDVDEMRSGAWFYVAPNDIFPEQFVQFLGFSDAMKQVFMEHHAELLQPEYWNGVKERLATGEVLEVIPYQPKSWVDHIKDGVYVRRPG
ncbi:MAG: bifunctional isocitrate dehydrogenase kinase/phosphatase [Pseudomonadota bacterium]